MNRSRTTLFKASLIALIVLLLAVAGLFQNGLNKERTALGMNRYVELKGAPPVLALTFCARRSIVAARSSLSVARSR